MPPAWQAELQRNHHVPARLLRSYRRSARVLSQPGAAADSPPGFPCNAVSFRFSL